MLKYLFKLNRRIFRKRRWQRRLDALQARVKNPSYVWRPTACPAGKCSCAVIDIDSGLPDSWQRRGYKTLDCQHCPTDKKPTMYYTPQGNGGCCGIPSIVADDWQHVVWMDKEPRRCSNSGLHQDADYYNNKHCSPRDSGGTDLATTIGIGVALF